MQSPINFGSVEAEGDLKKLVPKWGSGQLIPGAVLSNDGHAVKMSIASNNPDLPLEDPNKDDAMYYLKQFHFHSPSEHTVGGGRTDMEMHMVHENKAGNAWLAVSILYTESQSGANDFLNQFWHLMPSLSWNGGILPSNRTTTWTINVTAALPAVRDYFTYKGSFTTPPCTEAVKWYVFAQPVPISTTQLAALRGTMGGASWSPATSQFVVQGNYRPTQPVNGRDVSRFVDVDQEKYAYATVIGVCYVIASMGVGIGITAYISAWFAKRRAKEVAMRLDGGYSQMTSK